MRAVLPTQLTARLPSRRSVVRWTAFTVAAAATVALVVAGTARSTVAEADYYREVLDEERAYDRLYDQVLVDPEAAGVTRDLLGRLPVPQSVVTSNVKTVLPPTTVRAISDQVIDQSVAYLRGERDDLRLTVDLRPVLANVGDVGHKYFGTLVASLQQQRVPDYRAFNSVLNGALDDIAAGERPEGLPMLPLTQQQAARTADTVLGVVPPAERLDLRPRLEAALVTGDVATALAEIGPALFSPERDAAVQRLRSTADGSTWNVTADLDSSSDALSPLRSARSVTRVGLGAAQTAAAVLGVVALVVLWLTTPATPAARRIRLVGGALAAGGAVAALLTGAAWLVTGGSVLRPAPSWPGSVARLVDDVQRNAVDSLLTTALTTALFPLAAGLALIGGVWAWPRLAARNGRRLPRAWATASGTRWVATATGVVTAALAGALVAPAAFGGQADRRCQGSAELCDLPYDQLAQVASHNAMSTTQDRFIGPLQDPDITGQLNEGIRTLLVDTHHWELPEEIAARLALSSFEPGTQTQILDVIDRAAPARKGAWLCHAVCRAGAIPLVPELREIGDWLRANPQEVVTLLVQDGISGDETSRALRRAALQHLLYEPDDDPGKQWPTLGEMITEGKRLVVFAENSDGPAPSYRNFYRYGMETPFAFSSPDTMSCEPNRGGDGKRLFLMNHFITDDGGSRLAAGEINARERVLERARACERQRGRPVNYVAVDYATIGDAQGAVAELNHARAAALDG